MLMEAGLVLSSDKYLSFYYVSIFTGLVSLYFSQRQVNSTTSQGHGHLRLFKFITWVSIFGSRPKLRVAGDRGENHIVTTQS
ncbi:hypothetical protein BJX61DRAFT_520876 [Aspergillus egyptiacus]|nr:hypothetical protein BJX61DRAFT_520876 [Aspergillus egyptiacus]